MKKLLVIFLLMISYIAYSGFGNLSWVAPTEREDGTQLAASEIAGYKVYIDGNPYNQGVLFTGSGAQLELAPGNYAGNVTTVDTAGRQSVFSNTVNIVVLAPPVGRPNPPTNINWSTETVPGSDGAFGGARQ